jgi:hypothetical protein
MVSNRPISPSWAGTTSISPWPVSKITVRTIRDFLREVAQVFSTRRRSMSSVSTRKTSVSKVSSAEIDWVGRLGSTGWLSIPRESSHSLWP